MIKRTLQLLRADRRRRWSAAVVSAALVWSGPASAQSMLRFVGPDSPTPAVETLPAPMAPAAPAAPAPGSEFRLVEMTEGKAAPLPQFSVSARDVKATSQSTLKFGTSVPVQQSAAAPNAPAANSYDLRFKAPAAMTPASSVAIVQAPVAVPVAAPEIAPTQVFAAPETPVAARQVPSQQLASELFAKPASASNPNRPRIAMVLEHVPAPAPQHVDARPVQSAREMAPSYSPPAGSELFVSSPQQSASTAPTATAVSAKKWDLPAMDYGSALRQVQPNVAVLAPKPIEPTRVVARELPTSAAEMFGVGAAEPLVAKSPVEQPMTVPAVTPVAVAPRPIVANVQSRAAVIQTPTPAPLQLKPAAVSRSLVVSKPVQQPQAASIKNEFVASKPVAAPPVVAEPVRMSAPTPQVAVATPKLPPAAELDFSSVPATPEPVRPQFAPAPAVRMASATPIAVPQTQRALVPAAVAAPTQSQLPFAYQAGPLQAAPHVAEYKPAPVAPPVAAAPQPSQVVATVDAQDPNTYTLSFASNSGQTPAQFASEVGPEAVDGAPSTEAMPNVMPAPAGCNCGGYGQYGCPYLPGQSGTRALCGVDCGRCGSSCCSTWSDANCIPWALLGPGEYVGPARPAHVETYYLRVNDFLTLTFIESRKKSAEHYRIGVGDQLQIEWLQGESSTEKALDRELLVQPDGTVTLPLVGEVNAAGKTVNDFRDEVVKLYSKYQRDPQITVTPLTVNVAVQDVLKAVTSKNASSGQTQDVRVTPEGTIQAAGIGSVYVQGLSLDELRNELEARYAEAFGPGLAVSPQLTERATSYVFMGGEVRTPGRYVLEGPTTVMQAVALAGGWNNGGNLRQVVIFRRDENWCLKATKIDIRAPYYGKDPCPTNDVWLRDNDLVIVPKSCILCATDVINLYFTRGIYQVFPITYVYDLSQNTGLVPVP